MSSPANDNPYTPPATLADESALPAPVERPWQIVAAIWLEVVNWGTTFLMVGIFAPHVFSPRGWRSVPDVSVEFFGVPPFSLLALLCLSALILRGFWRGRHWARLAYLLEALVQLPWGGYEPPETLQAAIPEYSWYVLEAAVLVLLFLSSGRKWFRRRPRRTLF